MIALEPTEPSPQQLSRELLGGSEADGFIRQFSLNDSYVELTATQAIVYTSGTTGRPKGAMLSFANHAWNAFGSAINLGLRDDDVWLAAMPLFHVGGLAILMRGVIYGASVIVHEGFDPERVNAAIDRDGVSILSAVPTMLKRMLEARGDRPYPWACVAYSSVAGRSLRRW